MIIIFRSFVLVWVCLKAWTSIITLIQGSKPCKHTHRKAYIHVRQHSSQLSFKVKSAKFTSVSLTWAVLIFPTAWGQFDSFQLRQALMQTGYQSVARLSYHCFLTENKFSYPEKNNTVQSRRDQRFQQHLIVTLIMLCCACVIFFNLKGQNFLLKWRKNNQLKSTCLTLKLDDSL